MTKEKNYVFDKPLVKTQRFSVSMAGEKARVIVERKEVIRKTHHMGCTDGLPDDYIESRVTYDVYQEVSQLTRQKAIELVRKEVNSNE